MNIATDIRLPRVRVRQAQKPCVRVYTREVEKPKGQPQPVAVETPNVNEARREIQCEERCAAARAVRLIDERAQRIIRFVQCNYIASELSHGLLLRSCAA